MTAELDTFPYTFTSGKKKYVAIAFPKCDLEWLAEHLIVYGNGEPDDFSEMQMEEAKEIHDRIIDPAMTKFKLRRDIRMFPTLPKTVTPVKVDRKTLRKHIPQ